jgi:two-component system, OmpR family, sensor histidine kinase ChvG
MVAETDHHIEASARPQTAAREGKEHSSQRVRRKFPLFGFSSLTRRIVVLNLAGLVLFVSGILYLNQFRAGLTDTKVQSLLVQGEIIAGAIAGTATVDTDTIIFDPSRLLDLKPGESTSLNNDDINRLEFPINPERAAPILERLIVPTKTRARIYDRDGVLIVDTLNLRNRGSILRFDLPPPNVEKKKTLTTTLKEFWSTILRWVFSSNLPLQRELGGHNGRAFPEVVNALAGSKTSVVRVNKRGELIVSVAVPIQRFRAVLGSLVLSTEGGDIDNIVRAERWAIFRVFLVAASVTVLLSLLLAGTIAGPVKRLARAAELVRRGGTKARIEIPDLTERRDEIGYLSGSLREMTQALYGRIDAIERFAADVAHELKNPLTSLRSAAETLPLAKDDAVRQRLLEIIEDDVKRLDRLISDISDASRLDAELAREEVEPVDMALLLDAVVAVARDTKSDTAGSIVLDIAETEFGPDAYVVEGHDIRLGQVIRNLLDNAHSFSPANGIINVIARRQGGEIEVIIEDEGPGIPPQSLVRIFDRFHTDRPGADAFGKNSGLGLSISKQIIEAHHGQVWAENRVIGEDDQHITGASFHVKLPAIDAVIK